MADASSCWLPTTRGFGKQNQNQQQQQQQKQHNNQNIFSQILIIKLKVAICMFARVSIKIVNLFVWYQLLFWFSPANDLKTKAAEESTCCSPVRYVSLNAYYTTVTVLDKSNYYMNAFWHELLKKQK